MDLCHNCDSARTRYIGNGVQTDYDFTFEYNVSTDIGVAFWNEEIEVWQVIPNSDWKFLNETLIRFNEPPAFGQLFIIYRCTDLNPLPAEFHPGHSIKAQDLNDNFFVIKSAIEEARCAISRADETSETKYWNKDVDTITEEHQINGEAEAKIDEAHIFSAAGIAARHDSYVQPNKPSAIPYEQSGKIWNDTDDLQDFFWDADVGAWISFTKSGPAGPIGPYGPPGKVLISDFPPSEYIETGSSVKRPLEPGDLWFDSYHVVLYVYYVDNHGPGQWVSTSKIGGDGSTAGGGGTDYNFTAPLQQTGNTVKINIALLPSV